MKIVEIRNTTDALNVKDDIEKFCGKINYKDNYHVDYFNPATLVSCLYSSKRFLEPNGCLHLVYDNDIIVGLAGVEKAEFNNNISLLARRVSYLPEYRNQSIYSNMILYKQVDWCREQNIKMGLITWNKDRKMFYDAYKRMYRNGLAHIGYKYNNRYKNRLIIYEGLYIIKYTPQYIVGYIIDHDFKWNPKEDLEHAS